MCRCGLGGGYWLGVGWRSFCVHKEVGMCSGGVGVQREGGLADVLVLARSCMSGIGAIVCGGFELVLQESSDKQGKAQLYGVLLKEGN
jgi:hypothetical protein